MYHFHENLFTDVRIIRETSVSYAIQNGTVMSDSKVSSIGARIRVYDGTMWYTGTINSLENIQKEIDNLSEIARANEAIYDDPVIRNFGSSQADVRKYAGAGNLETIDPEEYRELVRRSYECCGEASVPEICSSYSSFFATYQEKEYYSSKGASVLQDMQRFCLYAGGGIVVNGITTQFFKGYQEMSFDLLKGHEEEICAERERYMDYAKNCVDVVPGEYVCVLAPIVTAMFTHESFGHKSEADFMLNDKTLRDEWVLGKKVGNDLVSICDCGSLDNNGYLPYDDEGNPATETWLIKNGVLTGRLHDSKSAAALGEAVTGNARADGVGNSPIVRMTNTYMVAGTQSPEDIIAEVQDGLYVYNVNYGTGSSTFTMQPNLCYRIRDGKLCEPVRANVLAGSVFKTLFDIDALGNDFILFNMFTCGKGNQSAPVSAGGPTIRVKQLNVN